MRTRAHAVRAASASFRRTRFGSSGSTSFEVAAHRVSGAAKVASGVESRGENLVSGRDGPEGQDGRTAGGQEHAPDIPTPPYPDLLPFRPSAVTPGPSSGAPSTTAVVSLGG